MEYRVIIQIPLASNNTVGDINLTAIVHNNRMATIKLNLNIRFSKV